MSARWWLVAVVVLVAELSAVVLTRPSAPSPGRFGSGLDADWPHATLFRSPDRAWQPAWDGGVVWFGDSLTVLARGEVAAAAPDWPYDAVSGRPLRGCVDAAIAGWRAARPGALGPRVVVLACGSNDVRDPRAVPGQVGRLLDALPEQTRVVMATVMVQRHEYPTADLRNSVWVNEQLHRVAAAADGRVILVDWASLAAAGQNRYLADGVHLTPTGRQRWVRLLRDAVPG